LQDQFQYEVMRRKTIRKAGLLWLFIYLSFWHFC